MGCFNQHLKNKTTLVDTAQNIIKQVRTNIYNEGIILAGLEWSEQPDEAIELINEALGHSLKVMLYTGLSEDRLYERISRHALLGCYVKFGAYYEDRRVDNYKSFGVSLASHNQFIKFIQ